MNPNSFYNKVAFMTWNVTVAEIQKTKMGEKREGKIMSIVIKT